MIGKSALVISIFVYCYRNSDNHYLPKESISRFSHDNVNATW
jgi:hypothetical protein